MYTTFFFFTHDGDSYITNANFAFKPSVELM